MCAFTSDQRADVYYWFTNCESKLQKHKIEFVREQFAQKYGATRLPSPTGIRWIAKKFEKYQHFENLKRERHRIVRNPIYINLVEKLVTENPNLSTRKIGRILKISPTAVGQILRQDLKMYPQKQTTRIIVVKKSAKDVKNDQRAN